ncbi:MBOAT family protein [Mariprofundus sp. EBB-1]|uniref:MBOAT family O-acyltransferase n=1 Tax=Mariprofundus sp. EBB-1 TaxID=2650971 RepID=UPI001911AD67|nr:MBOAT family protein [Mariprofundus sp. EBB-1]
MALFAFYILGKRFGHEIAMLWLVLASLFFYAWWNPLYIWLILLSMLFNYGMGLALSGRRVRRTLLTIGVVANIMLLGYYKYANFFVNTVNDVTGASFNLDNIILPLAISFFTFQQIAYLVDAYQRKTEEHSFLHYALFVTFFPQLIAGPIVHHGEMMRQFSKPETFRFNAGKMELGLAIFSLGLFKKVFLADGVARYSTPVFQAASAEESITVIDAWIGSLGYSFQLYFDFSAYSDMAIGIALMFGISLPINFMSPYKAVNIIDFWRRWHMTLSRFLRDYLYFPLGGNRKGEVRRYTNLLITMLLGGLWHGAGWTFAFWGLLHGGYLIVNHAWHHMRRLLGHDLEKSTFFGRVLARGITFLAIVIGWVYFRAESFESANLILSTMFGLQHVSILGTTLFPGRMLYQVFVWFAGLSVLVWLMPNVLQWTGYVKEQEIWNSKWIPHQLRALVQFRRTVLWALFGSVLMIVSILKLTHISEFLYFQF